MALALVLGVVPAPPRPRFTTSDGGQNAHRDRRSENHDLARPAVRSRRARADPSWQALGEDERTTIATALGDLALDVQHVASTAVPGLDAKPILDIAVALDPEREMGKDDLIAPMTAAGYEFVTDVPIRRAVLCPVRTANNSALACHRARRRGPASSCRVRSLARCDPPARRSRCSGASAATADLVRIEVAVDAMRNDGLARFERELTSVQVDVDLVRHETRSRTRAISGHASG